MRHWRVAYLATHPIQYQAPLLRLVAEQPDIELTAFFCSDFSVGTFTDAGFGHAIQWDVPLLDGYAHEFLPALGRTSPLNSWRPLNHGLADRLRKGRFDALWVHGWGHASLIRGVLVARRLGVKVLLRGEAGTHLSQPRWPKRAVKERFLRWFLPQVDAFLAIGTRNRDFYLGRGVSPERIFMMPYAVDNRFFQEQARKASRDREHFRSTLGLEAGRPVILYASKMTGRKRPRDLLDAYAGLSSDDRTEPHPYLIFVGDGELLPALEQKATAMGWNSIRFLGFKNQTELPRYYDLCDVFVLPSVNEPWGLVVNEAMNAARPVIVSDQVGCAPDLIRQGQNGFIYKPGNVGELRQALRTILEAPSAIETMGRRSLQIISCWGVDKDLAGLRQALGSFVGAR